MAQTSRRHYESLADAAERTGLRGVSWPGELGSGTFGSCRPDSPTARAAEAEKETERRRATTFAVYAERWLQRRVPTRGKALRPNHVPVVP